MSDDDVSKTEYLSQGVVDDEFAKQLGHILVKWNSAENTMFLVLEKLIGGDSEVASRIFFTMRNQLDRLKMMHELLKLGRLTGLERRICKAHLSWFQELNEQRNILVHGLFYTRSDGKIVCEKPKRGADGRKVYQEWCFNQLRAFQAEVATLEGRTIALTIGAFDEATLEFYKSRTKFRI